MTVTKKPRLQLTIQKAIYGGAGLGHAPEEDAVRAGKAIFVPMTLPGEVVEIEVVQEKNQFASARLLRVVTPSADRIDARCQHYGVCGGCDYQHSNYAAQLNMKQAILQETLERAGLKKIQDTLPEIEVHASEPWEYRNRIRLHVAILDGRAQLGYRRAQSNVLVPIRECPIGAQLLVRCALTLDSMAYEDLAVLDVLSGTTEVEFFCNRDESALQVTLIPRSADVPDEISLAALRSGLKERVPELQLLAWQGDTGGDGMQYSVAEEMYRVPQGAFFQVNRYLLAELLDTVTAGRTGKIAWDLYAGVGFFARVLAKKFEHTEAVESSFMATSLLGQNLDLCESLGKHRVHKYETLQFLMQQVKKSAAKPDLIVVDPPRAGLGAEVCKLIATSDAAEIVYLSCDPATMARDLVVLIQSGYRCDELHMFDMFPQTSHIETMVVLAKASASL